MAQATVVNVLFAMALALSLASLAFGAIAGRLQRHGIRLEKLFATILLLFLAAQLAIVLRLPIPVVAPWIVIAATGSATVVSYSILASYVPKHRLGRANAALNLLHLLVAFAVQGLIGAIIDLLASAGGAHQLAAYQTAIAIILAIECAAFAWFVVAVEWTIKDWSWPHRTWPKVLAAHPVPLEGDRYLAARRDWDHRLNDARVQARAWRTAALASTTVLFVLATLAFQSANHSLVLGERQPFQVTHNETADPNA